MLAEVLIKISFISFFFNIYIPTNLLLIYMLLPPKRVILTCITYAAYYSAHQYSFLLWYGSLT